MKLGDIIKLSMNSITHRRLRSWLTILGIVIGVAAVVALVSIGQGMQARVTEQLSGLGADLITVSPGFSRAEAGGFRFRVGVFGGFGARGNLTESDMRIIKTTPGVLYVNGIVSGRADISYLGQSASVNIQGVDTSVWRFMETVKLESGRYLSVGDSNVVVIGNRVANDMFKQPITLNRQIQIDGRNFRVVGILSSSGFIGQQDSSVFMPRDIARKILDLNSNRLSSISIKAADSSIAQDVAAQIESRLMMARHVTKDTQDFTVSTAQAIQEQVSSITQTITLFLGSIAAISLLVGGIGIANTMFTSVMERTRQIGVLKALGMTNFEVMKIFLIESALMGLFGGIAGVLLGFLVSVGISELGIRFFGPGAGGGITTVITPELVLFAIGFSVFIGIMSGLLPARRAANLQPVEALRYE
ncbi:MAG: ABC transporter permease [Candidatus Aenigmatarchaeota archaeon]|nr:ABC transporter permease [Candidatus Aenigmarchaeota archaeon]